MGKNLLLIIFSPLIKLLKLILLPFMFLWVMISWMLVVLAFPVMLVILILTYLPIKIYQIHTGKEVDKDNK